MDCFCAKNILFFFIKWPSLLKSTWIYFHIILRIYCVLEMTKNLGKRGWGWPIIEKIKIKSSGNLAVGVA